ncbi:MAG: hypothetical protein ABEI53_02145 [Candidatus Magasanikbacteria bacterium]
MSIFEKLNIEINIDKDWIIAIMIVALIGSASFGGGYLFGVQKDPSPIIIKRCNKS